MIATRIEKLRFLVEEMQIALHLATQATDPFLARTLTRHILVRAENFIAHARSLRKPLNQAGLDTSLFHEKKEFYAKNFDEYFIYSRHRLGAHVQDFDFGKRIELWNDIEIVKIGFFVEGAQEIYESLRALNLPGFVPYTSPQDLTNSSIGAALHQYERTVDHPNWVEFGVDPLAMTRRNTTAALNTHPTHSRASQLALINRWIIMQKNLLIRLEGYPSVIRILKSRIITDIVSFCDCLVTRQVAPGALQAMDGLDLLIRTDGESSAPIDDYVAHSNFHFELQGIRTIRDAIGAHLESDDSYTIQSLLKSLDTFNLSEGFSFYDRVYASFRKTCYSIIYLHIYPADGERLFGITANGGQSTPFAGDVILHNPSQILPPVNEEEAYQRNLTRWFYGDSSQQNEARQFFWSAFQTSELVETIDEIEILGGVQRLSKQEFRKAHQFIGSVLDQLSDSELIRVLELMVSCRGGWPYALAETLVRYGRNAIAPRQQLVCRALAEIGSAPHASVSQFLQACAEAESWTLRLEAKLAHYKRFVNNEGLYRVNHRGHILHEYDPFVASLVKSIPMPERLLYLLAFASVLGGPHLGSLATPFKDNYIDLQAQIHMLCVRYLKDDAGKSKATTLRQLIETQDYVGVCLLLALDLRDETPRNADQNSLHSALIDCCCYGTIVTAAHDQARRHLAMCFLEKKDYFMAFQIVNRIASSNPEQVDMQVLATEILGETSGAENETLQRVSEIRRGFKLSPELEKRLGLIEREIAQRKGQTH